MKSSRVGTIPFKQNHRCACPINYPSAYSGKHINSPIESSLFEFDSSLTELESYAIQLERSLIQLESSPIQLEHSLIE